MHDHFGIAARAKSVSQRLQFRHQFLIIVDFAVEHHDDALVFVVERLLAGGQVDDRQPAMAKPDARFEVHPAFIRPPMKKGLVHALEEAAVDFAPPPAVKYSGDSAHYRSPVGDSW